MVERGNNAAFPVEERLLEPGQWGEELFVFPQLDDAVAEQGGFFELQIFGGFSHLRFKVFDETKDLLLVFLTAK